MPQFDFTTYSSQVFWLIVCFAILYYFVSKIILPRIHDIISDRSYVINQDLSLAKDLEKQSSDLQIKAAQLRQDAISQYQIELDHASKNAQIERDSLIEKLKEKLDHNAKKSHKELQIFIANSKNKVEEAAKNLTQAIKEKFLN